MKKTKQITSFILVVVMVVCMLPMSVFATDTTTYAVTVSKGEGGSVTGEGSYAPGAQVTITATPDTANGYCAAGWGLVAVDGGVISPINQKTSHTFTMPVKDVAISITFEQHSYISHKNNENGTHDVHCIYCGDVQTASEPCVDVHSGGNYATPNGWCDKCSARMPGIWFIEFAPNGGEGEMNPAVVNNGESYTVPANGFTLDGHTFQGWATESTATHAAYQPGDTYTVNADTTFYAIWNDNAHIHNHPTTWSSGKDGHWYECKCGDRKDFAAHTPGAPATATTSQTCTVCGYEIAPATGYTLTLDYVGTVSGVTVGSGSKTVTGIAAGTVVDLSEHWPATTTVTVDDVNYYFHGFVDSDSGNGLILRTVTMNSDLTLNASWVITPMITVTFDTNDGSMPYEKRRVSCEQTLAVINANNQPTRAAYAFAGWSLADDGTADSDDTQITTDCTLYAVWQQDIPSYDDDFPPASIPVGGNYDAILRNDVVIIRGDDPISGTLDLTGTNAEAIRFTDDAVRESIAKGDISTIVFSSGTAATMTGSGWAAAYDALRSGEDLQISVTKVDADALPEELTEKEPFEDDAVLFDWDTLSPTTIFTEEELLDLGVIGANDDDITWEELKYLYHYMTPEEIDFLWSYINSTQAQYADTQLLAWLNEMIERDATSTAMTLYGLKEYANLTYQQTQILSDMGLQNVDNPTIGQIRQLGLTLKQMELLYAEIDSARAEANEPANQYDVLLSWLEDAIEQKELEALYAQMDEWIGSLSVTDYGGEALVDAKLAAESMTTAELERFLENAHATNMMASSLALGDLISFLEDELEAREASDTPTYINTSGTNDGINPIFIGAVDVNIGAVKADGTTTPIAIKANRSDAVAWSTNVNIPKLLLEEPEWNTKNIRAYKVLEDGGLEAKAAKVTVNADGTLILSAMSDGNSTYIFVLMPGAIDTTPNSTTPEWEYWYWVHLLNQTFDITATSTEGGTISPTGTTTVRFNNTVRYTIAPADGYEISAVYIDGKDVGITTKYTFKNVREKHTIHVVFEKAPWQNPFKDIHESDWYYEDVKFVYENALMIGVSTNLDKFAPELPLNRATVVTSLWRLAGSPITNKNISFGDLGSDWYTEAMRWAIANGIILGYGDGTCRPLAEITHEQAVAIFHRFVKYTGLDEGIPMVLSAQLDYSDWAEDDVLWALSAGLFNGFGSDISDLTQQANRAEVAAYLHKLCKMLEE